MTHAVLNKPAMVLYEESKTQLRRKPQTWLVTGAAGFIGSHLLEALLKLDQRVKGLDNFSTGTKKNLEDVQSLVSSEQWNRFHFIQGDLLDPEVCQSACREVDVVLHEAALGSVPFSVAEPLKSHQANVTGFLNLLCAASQAKVSRVVYASSSAVYGDDSESPKIEERLGKPLSPYAATKWMDEVYAGVFNRSFHLDSIGLRYFNVFGPRQDPEGAYAAVIPKWIAAFLLGEPVRINGDGETSRDFCYIENVVQSNLLAATTKTPDALNEIFNVGLGQRTTLNQLFQLLKQTLRSVHASVADIAPVYCDFRSGDVRHSLADISKAQRLLGYAPTHNLEQGLALAMNWYQQSCA